MWHKSILVSVLLRKCQTLFGGKPVLEIHLSRQDMCMLRRHLGRYLGESIQRVVLLHLTLCFKILNLFLRWARSKGLIVGLVSNAEYRYQEVILPALDLNMGGWDFGVFSGIEGIEKSDPRIYKLVLERVGNVAPDEVLHIGDSMRKDYVPAKSIGMHALLLDRFQTEAAEDWREAGAIVLPDLVAVQEL